MMLTCARGVSVETFTASTSRSFHQPSPLPVFGTSSWNATAAPVVPAHAAVVATSAWSATSTAGAATSSPQKRRGQEDEEQTAGETEPKAARRARTTKRPRDQCLSLLEFVKLDTRASDPVSRSQLDDGLRQVWEWYSEVVAKSTCNFLVLGKVKVDSTDLKDIGTYATDAAIEQLPQSYEKGRKRPGPEVLFMLVELEWVSKRRTRCWAVLDIRRLKNTVRCWTFVRDMKCDMGVLQWARHPRNYLREFAVEVCAPEQVESRGWMSGHCAFAACQYFLENFVRSGGIPVRKLPLACVLGYREKAISHDC